MDRRPVLMLTTAFGVNPTGVRRLTGEGGHYRYEQMVAPAMVGPYNNGAKAVDGVDRKAMNQ